MEPADSFYVGKSTRSGGWRFSWARRRYWDLQSYFWDGRLPGPQAVEQARGIVDTLSGYLSPERPSILDLGCGTGMYALALAQAGFSVLGIDFAPRMLERARSKVHDRVRARLAFHQMDFNEGLAFPRHSFDAALCVYVLQYATSLPGFLAEVARVLRPGGVFLVAPARVGSCWCQTRPLSVSKVLHLTVAVLPGPRGRVQIMTRRDLLAALRDAGFEVIEERDLGPRPMFLARTLRQRG